MRVPRSDLTSAGAWLADLARREVRPGPYTLDVVHDLLKRLDDPHLAYPAVHVAGTRGKGSTCALVAAALHEAGHRVGLTTSPHLVEPTERIRIGEDDISEEKHLELVARVRQVGQELEPSYFETLIVAAFLAFAEAAVDVAVVEVGLGGRLDATNVVRPVVTAITRLGLDHADRLGDTPEQVAAEKAGILKSGVPAVLAPNAPGPTRVVERRAAELDAPLIRLGVSDVRAAPVTALAGRVQRENAAVARAVLDVLEGTDLEVSADARSRGFARVRWPGRLQFLPGASSVPDLLLDVAHDPESVRAAMEHLEQLRPANAVVFSCLADKDLDGMVAALAEAPALARAAIFVPELEGSRGRRAAAACAKLIDAGLEASAWPDVRGALRAADRAAAENADGLVVALGSFRVTGEVLRARRGRGGSR